MRIKWYIFLLFLLPAMCFPAPVAAKEVEIGVVVDGERIEFDHNLVWEEGRLLAPIRELFTAMGAKVFWEETSRTALVVADHIEVKIPVGSNLPTIDGLPYTLDVPAAVIESRTYVPLRFAAESLGGEVSWDAASDTAYIETAIAEPAGGENGGNKKNINEAGMEELAGIEGICEELAVSIIEHRDESGGVIRTFEELKTLLPVDAYNAILENYRIVYTEKGTGSWYGARFHGNMTYYGETFDMNKYTAAHPTLPQGTMVEVTFIPTGISTWVRVNDRGPNQLIHPDRIIDLSRAASDHIGLTPYGLGQVKLTIVKER